MTTTEPVPRPSRSSGSRSATHLYELVLHRADTFPLSVALGSQQGLRWRTLDSRELVELVDSLARELASRHGVQASDRVVLWLPNDWRTPVYLFALWKLGAVVVPFDREMNPEAGSSIIDSVEPRCVLVGYAERPVWARQRTVIEWWEPQRSVDRASSVWHPPAEDLAAIFFTSGTTGTPKGCMITHANLMSQVQAGFERIPLDSTCRLASLLPLSHLFELTCGMLYPLAAGAAIHYIPTRRGPDIIRVLSEQRITHMMVVPQLLGMMGQALDQQLRANVPKWLYQAMNSIADRLPLARRRMVFSMVHSKLGGHLRLLASGGAPLAPETQQLWERMGIRVVQGYGTSECSPIVACGAVDGTTPAGSVGRPVRGVEVRLSPEGELLVRGPNVMRGYWHDPARTAEVLADGWYATGDLARIDPSGNIWLGGRARDLIVLPSGLNVWPQDVEDVLRQEPAVLDAAVVAVPRQGGGASLHAYLIPANAAARSGDLGALVARCNGRLAQHQRLASASWWHQADFPRTSTLKVRRHLLPVPEQLESVQVASVLAADDPVAQAVAGLVRSLAVNDDQTLGELGLDSLGLVELAVALEDKTGKLIADSDLRQDMTVSQLRAFLASAPDADSGNLTPDGQQFDGMLPLWPYTWGRRFRFLAAPIDLLYRIAVTRTIVLGKEHLAHLPERVIFAGTHHSFPDMPLVRFSVARFAGRRMARRLVIATAAGGFNSGGPRLGRGLGLYPWYGIVALGLYPLRQERQQDVSLRGLVRVAELGRNSILIFPQGTHATPEQERTDDPTVRFHPGVAYLASALSAPVIPFGLAGTEVVMPHSPQQFRGRLIAGIPVSIRRAPLAIAFGAPLTLADGEDAGAFVARLQTICYGLTRDAEQSLDLTGHPR